MMKRIMCGLALGLSAILIADASVAQEEVVQDQGHQVEMAVIADDQGGAPMIFATSETFDGGESTGIRIMGGPGAMTFLNAGGPEFGLAGGGAPDPWGMLSNPSVQKDLELVGDQLKKVKDLQSEFAKTMQEQIGDLSKGGIGAERFKGLPELMKRLRSEQQEQMKGLLLPHQIDRLHQVALQSHLKQAGTAAALASEKLAEELGITNEQIDKLKKRSKEINEQLAKDMEQLKEKARDNLLMELSLDQRNKLKKLMGEKYEPQNKDWEEQFNGVRRRGPRVIKENN